MQALAAQRMALGARHNYSSRAPAVFRPAPTAPLAPRRASRSAVRAEATAAAPKTLVQGRNVEVTPAIKSYVEEKCSKAVAHYSEGIKEIDVKLSVRGNPRGRGTEAHHQRDQIVEVTVFTQRHGVVRVEECESDLYAAVDLVSDKLKRKLVKVKERAVQKATWPGRGGPKGGDTITAHLDTTDVVDKLPIDQVAPPVPEVVREKMMNIAAMTTNDALEQIENVGHDFYLFRDSEDANALKVLYRRKSHGYGVIVPRG
ncbi:ribosome-binding factor chloroplastic [Micractinium conductrix]|uniref:Ribosome-binding factor chloroplastic n=1 Tax=Micractinium conductrix TaxID=554055 RepID=A0A2P6VCT4_9CHLO|nr:ribosome-binding factor chloroplastic [Micractinium conductrix]|eukprot:PSC71905.1 ribosome-binding factor chloroplastic [Micractinium conductrix]